jgi:hypothetical protein
VIPLEVDKHRRTIQAIFERRANIPWADIEKI